MVEHYIYSTLRGLNSSGSMEQVSVEALNQSFRPKLVPRLLPGLVITSNRNLGIVCRYFTVTAIEAQYTGTKCFPLTKCDLKS